VLSPFSPVDPATGLRVLIGMLAPLRERGHTGRGGPMLAMLIDRRDRFVGRTGRPPAPPGQRDDPSPARPGVWDGSIQTLERAHAAPGRLPDPSLSLWT